MQAVVCRHTLQVTFPCNAAETGISSRWKSHFTISFRIFRILVWDFQDLHLGVLNGIAAVLYISRHEN